MATPKNLNAEFPDYCSNCRKGDYEIDTDQNFFGHSDYSIRCIYREVCDHWVSFLFLNDKEVTDG